MNQALSCSHCGESFKLHDPETLQCPSCNVFRDTTYKQGEAVKQNASQPYHTRGDVFDRWTNDLI